MSQTALTPRDYPARPEDGRRYAILAGAHSVPPAPTPKHQTISIRLAVALFPRATADGGTLYQAPLDVILGDTTIVQPDLVYVATDRLGRISGRGIEGAPTLAVEILSPSTRIIDRVTKTRLYTRHGVPFLWLIDPDARTIEAFVLERDRYALALTATGSDPVDLPPFAGLSLVPYALWP
jgi:Uma2 family endonuclease